MMKTKHAARGLLVAALLIGAGAGCRTVVPGSGGSGDPLDAREAAYAEALALYSQGFLSEKESDPSEAASYYRKSLEKNPNYERAYLRLALACLKQGEQQEAAEVMASLVERRPDSFQAHLWQGRVLRETDQVEAAEAAFRTAMQLDPANLLPVIDLANLFRKGQRDQDAIVLLREEISQRENTADLSRFLAQLYLARAARAQQEESRTLMQEEALGVLLQGVKREMDNEALRAGLGDLYLQMKRVQEAVEQYEALRRINPDNLEALQKLALCYVAQGEELKAVEALEGIAGQQRANGRVLLYLGELLERLGETKKAEKQYRRALKTQEGMREIAYIRLALMMMDDRPDEAAGELEQGLLALPNNPRLLEMLAYLYMNEDRHDEARTYFDKARTAIEQTKPDALSAQFSLYHALSMQFTGDPEQAAAYLFEATEKDPNYLGAYVQLVFSEEDDALETSALDVLDALEKLMPEELTIPMFRGLIQSERKAYPEAIAAFEQAEKTANQYEDGADFLTSRFYFWYGAACERDGQIERAEELLGTCLELDEEYAEAYNYLAYMWAERNEQLDESLEYVNQALELEPGSGAYIDTLGWIYYRQGEYEKALEQIRLAGELIPEDPTITDHLGDILLALEQTDEAVEAWKQAFIGDPEIPGLADKLSAQDVKLAPLRKKAEQLRLEREAAKEKALPESASRPEAPAEASEPGDDIE